MSQRELGLDDGAPDPERLRALEVDRTPAGVVAQGLAQFALHAAPQWDRRLPISLCDPCAGDGVFVDEARKRFHVTHARAIEIRPEEAPVLRSKYDRVDMGDLEQVLTHQGPFRSDLVVGNPAFSLFVPIVESWLEHGTGPYLMLFGLTSVMQRAAKKVAFCRRHGPSAEYRVAGPIWFRHGINPRTGRTWGADQRSYSWWLWVRSPVKRGPLGWATFQLPMLSVGERKAGR